MDLCFSKPRVPETIWHAFERSPSLSGENFDSSEKKTTLKPPRTLG